MYPGGMKGPTCGLSQQPAEAEGSLTLEAQGRAESSPDNDGAGRHYQTTRARQARREGVATSEPVVEPPQAWNRLQIWWIWAGQQRAPTWTYEEGDSVAVLYADGGGHGEGLRRTRGEAAGEELGTAPVDRCMVNMGTIPRPPSSSRRMREEGKARRRPMAAGWGGAPVVVRGRESRPHGEGGQRVRSDGAGMPGGRR
jgi:hypothetical protein